MKCSSPIRAYRTISGEITFRETKDTTNEIELPCGQCIGCRVRRANDWTVRLVHEAQMHRETAFLTLTYSTENLPPNQHLRHRDAQLFLKRLRKAYTGKTIRFFLVGEYGGETQRPHYHACIYGHAFYPRKAWGKSQSGQRLYTNSDLDTIWGLGHATVQDLTPETAAYCARYVIEKRTNDTTHATINEDGELTLRPPEYAQMSRRPGIGATWYDKYKRSLYPLDRAVLRHGRSTQVPKYYDLRAKDDPAIDWATIEDRRLTRAMDTKSDSTPERQRAKELVHLARQRSKGL